MFIRRPSRISGTDRLTLGLAAGAVATAGTVLIGQVARMARRRQAAASGDAGVFTSQAQELYDAIASADKRLEHLPGDHYFQEPANARDDVADLIASWVAAH